MDRNEKGQFVKGYILTTEERLQLSKMHTGHFVSEATKLKQSLSMTGKKHSEESKLKMGVIPFISDGVLAKHCTVCKQIKPLEAFSKSKRKKCGFSSQCKDCNREYRKNNIDRIKNFQKEYNKNNKKEIAARCKEYRENNVERLKEWHTEYNKNNADIIKEKKKIYNVKNAARIRKHQKEYRLNHIGLYKERDRKYNQNNKEKVNASHAAWIKNNPEKAKEINKRRLVISMLNPRNKLNKAISLQIYFSLKNGKGGRHWEDLVSFTLQDLMTHLEKQFKPGMSFNNHGKWHIDHKIPKSLFEFETYNDREFKQCWALSNLQPLWAFDNLSKGNKIA